MSSHTIDLSGQRPVSMGLNDPAATKFWTTAKAGDDLTGSIGGVREVRIQLAPAGARIEKREFITRRQRLEGGKAVRDDDGNYVFDETPYVGYVLVLPGSVSYFGRTSNQEDAEEGTYENTPHTSLTVRRQKESHFTESGTLIEDYDIGELLGIESA